MSNEEYILRASIANEATTFQASDTAAGYIIPEVWSRKIEEFAKANIVLAQLGVINTELLGNPGDVVNIAVDAELTAAALTESVSASISAISYTQVTVTPSEQGVAVSVTRKTMERAFNNVMEDQSRIMGYALAKRKDSLVASLLAGTAVSEITANGVATSALASSDTFDSALIANGISTMRKNDVQPRYLVIHPACENSLLKDSNFIDSSKYGGREVVMNGEIGRYLGLQVFTSTIVPASATPTGDVAYDNFLLGPRAFVIAEKMRPRFDSKYEPLDRAWSLIAVEDYGMSLLNSNHALKLVAYKGI